MYVRVCVSVCQCVCVCVCVSCVCMCVSVRVVTTPLPSRAQSPREECVCVCVLEEPENVVTPATQTVVTVTVLWCCALRACHLCTTVCVLFVRVAGATCVCVGRVARRHRTCAVAVRPALSLRETTRSVLRFLVPLGLDRQVSRDTALHLQSSLLYRQTRCCAVGKQPSVAPCVRGAFGRRRCGQSRKQHLCAQSTLLSHLRVKEWDMTPLSHAHLTPHLHVWSGARPDFRSNSRGSCYTIMFITNIVEPRWARAFHLHLPLLLRMFEETTREIHL